MLVDVFGSDLRFVPLVTALLAVGALAYLLGEVAARLVRTLLVTIAGTDADASARFHSPIVRRPIRITRTAVFVAALFTLTPPALDLVGASVPVGLTFSVLTGWMLGSGLRVVIIALLTYLLVRILASGARRLEDAINHDPGAGDATERLKRARTLSRLLERTLSALLTAIASLMVLRELNVDIMPILTGAGIVGLAVGFGAQTLVKDLIAGFFLILENQVRVGDVATINGTGGLVEAINLRTVVLRDLEGAVHVFPNGSIATLANRTKDFSYYVVDVGVAHKEDTDTVTDVLRDVGAELAADPRYQRAVLEPLDILGVDAFGDTHITIRIRIKTVPLKQWEVGRELRRRIKKAFDARGIETRTPDLYRMSSGLGAPQGRVTTVARSQPEEAPGA
jgi:small conductance mechanosensitive channel